MSPTHATQPASGLVRLVEQVACAPTADEQDRAMAELQPVVQRIAAQVGAAFNRRIRQELNEEAAGHIWHKIRQGKFDLKRSPMDDRVVQAWCARVLRRLAIDVVRRVKRQPVSGTDVDWSGMPNKEAPPPLPATGPAAVSIALDSRLVRLRQTLDQLAWSPDPGAKCDLFAVLLIRLRLKLGDFLRGQAAGSARREPVGGEGI